MMPSVPLRTGNGPERTPACQVDAVTLSGVEEDLALAQVFDLDQSSLGEPAGDFLPAVPGEVARRIPVERVADPDLPIGVHRDADRQEMQGHPGALDEPMPAGHQPPLEAAHRRG